METFWSGILRDIITTVVGAAFVGISTMLGFYIKRITDNLKYQSLVNYVDKSVRWAEQYPAFKDYEGEQKFNIVFARSQRYARDNGVSISDEELLMLVEAAVQVMNSGKLDFEDLEKTKPILA